MTRVNLTFILVDAASRCRGDQSRHLGSLGLAMKGRAGARPCRHCACASCSFGISKTQNDPPWLTWVVSVAMSPPQSGTAPP